MPLVRQKTMYTGNIPQKKRRKLPKGVWVGADGVYTTVVNLRNVICS